MSAAFPEAKNDVRNEDRKARQLPRGVMKANVFRAAGRFGLEGKAIPQAEYVLIPHEQANRTVLPNALSDQQVLLLAHVASTGFVSAVQAEITLRDAVAVFTRDPVGLCAVLGARLRGATGIIAVDRDPARLQLARPYGTTIAIEAGEGAAAKIQDITDGRGIDVACVETSTGMGNPMSDAYGGRETFESALRALRPGGTLLNVGVSCGQLKGLSDRGSDAEATSGTGRTLPTIVTTLCPGGKLRVGTPGAHGIVPSIRRAR